MADFTKDERDALLRRAWEMDARLYPEDEGEELEEREAARLEEAYYLTLGEYADRLPRIVMSACPFSGNPLLHSFDPWGLDGPWWHQDREVEIQEPASPASFKVLLGALDLRGREPGEVRDTVNPGPDVPFVVPRLLELPGMVAVVSRLELATGDLAYPIVYYSEEEISPRFLHQFWLEQDLWFKQEDGSSSWLIANDIWDFDLVPWVESGKLRWIEPGDEDSVVLTGTSGKTCPYVGLEGDRLPQILAFGERELIELPDGTPINPYEE